MDLRDQLSVRLVQLKADRENLIASISTNERVVLQQRAALQQFEGAIVVLEEALAPQKEEKKPEKPAKTGK